MQLGSLDIHIENIDMYCPTGVKWKDHFKKFFQYQKWDDVTETVRLVRLGKYRINIVREKSDAVALLQKQQKAKLDKAA
jgi:hypothetical protein